MTTIIYFLLGAWAATVSYGAWLAIRTEIANRQERRRWLHWGFQLMEETHTNPTKATPEEFSNCLKSFKR